MKPTNYLVAEPKRALRDNATVAKEKKTVRALLLFFIIILFLSGLTAIPLGPELTLVLSVVSEKSMLHQWLFKVLLAYNSVRELYPFLLYGYDWLAFAHFVLAVLFIGPYRDLVRNIWVLQFGLIACILVIPLALIAGPLRGIPIGWQLTDCSFGVFGFIPLWICYRKTRTLEHLLY